MTLWIFRPGPGNNTHVYIQLNFSIFNKRFHNLDELSNTLVFFSNQRNLAENHPTATFAWFHKEENPKTPLPVAVMSCHFRDYELRIPETERCLIRSHDRSSTRHLFTPSLFLSTKWIPSQELEFVNMWYIRCKENKFQLSLAVYQGMWFFLGGGQLKFRL